MYTYTYRLLNVAHTDFVVSSFRLPQPIDDLDSVFQVFEDGRWWRSSFPHCMQYFVKVLTGNWRGKIQEAFVREVT